MLLAGSGIKSPAKRKASASLLCRCDIGAVKAVLWNDCRMGKNNEMGALFKAQGTVNTER